LVYLGFALGGVFAHRIRVWMEIKRALRDEKKEFEENSKKQTIIHILEPAEEEPPRLQLSGEWWCRNM
jgi:hypothetical protein